MTKRAAFKLHLGLGALLMVGWVLLASYAHGEIECTPRPGDGRYLVCWDTNKGGAPDKRIEPNQFGGYDVRHDNGTIIRCNPEATGQLKCRKIGK